MTDKKVLLSGEDLDQVAGGFMDETVDIGAKIWANRLLRKKTGLSDNTYDQWDMLGPGNNPSDAFTQKLASVLGLQSITFNPTEETTAIDKHGNKIGYDEICKLIKNYKG